MDKLFCMVVQSGEYLILFDANKETSYRGIFSIWDRETTLDGTVEIEGYITYEGKEVMIKEMNKIRPNEIKVVPRNNN